MTNRAQRRHPKSADAPKPADGKESVDKGTPADEQSIRAKSHRHKKVTADKWNQ